MRDEDGVFHREDMGTRLTITEDEKDKLYSIRDFWVGKTVSEQMDSWYPDGFEEWRAIRASSYLPELPIGSLPSGHLIAGYPKIIKTGYAAIRAQAQQWIDDHQGNLMGGDVEKYMFYKSAVLVCDAASAMIRRFAQACYDKAQGGRPGSKERTPPDGVRSDVDLGEAGPHVLGGGSGNGHVSVAALHGLSVPGSCLWSV